MFVFRFHIPSLNLTTKTPTTLPELLSSFCDTRRSLFDQHAILITKKTSRPRSNPWMTSDLIVFKAHRRKLERMNNQSRSKISSNKDPQAINIANSSLRQMLLQLHPQT